MTKVVVDPARRQEFLDYMAKAHREEEVIYDYRGPTHKIPFISPMLTWATTGGMSVGHMGRWYGPEGSGKSLTNWGLLYCAQNYPQVISELMECDVKWLESRRKNFLAKALKARMKESIKAFPNGMSGIIFDTEQRADLELAARMGIDTRPGHGIEIVNNNIIEEIIEDARRALSAYHIVIIDSASNAQSVMAAQLEPGQYDRGSDAQAWKRLRQLRTHFNRREHTLIIVDQVRTAPDAMQGTARRGTPTAPPNVRFLRHNASLAIEYAAGRDLYFDKKGELTDDYDKASRDIAVLGADGLEPVGLEMKGKIIKNSTGRPKRNFRMRFKFPIADVETGELIQDVGFDTAFELAEIGIYFGMIEKSGSFFYVLDDNKRRASKAMHGEPQLRAAIRDDKELQDRILGRLHIDQQPPSKVKAKA